MFEAGSRSAPPAPPFFVMEAHGEGVRLPLSSGTVVLSRLGAGRSRLRALAPSVKYVLEGEEVYEIEGRTRRLGAGEFMLVEAGVEFEARTNGPQRTTGLCIYLSTDGDAAVAGDPALGLGRALSGSRIDPLAATLGNYARLLADRPAAGPALARRIVHEATIGAEDYLAAFANRLERLACLKQSTRIETLQRVERARCFLHDHAARPVTLEEVATHAALSRFHLTRSFSEVFGLPPLAYHRRLRLEAAARLLKSHAASATDIAAQLGYASLSAFTRAFRGTFGVPPSRVGELA
ncbi:AraC family transcriptional regulator [Sphingomonas parva]|uniref:AraC family transcriptional regulator n=2 Tax=Sphingomonas parva TaxID=2555898 RepID=A0A4Y8ZXV8_9SPHN|nr:AraC family transcriptional regulator [Sphingomonas parva]